jgi:hypothetical protein
MKGDLSGFTTATGSQSVSHAGGIVASAPIKMVNIRKPPRKIVIFAIQPPIP